MESVITVTGTVKKRSNETIGSAISSGEVEAWIEQLLVQALAEPLPMPVNQDAGYPEDIRLKYRFLDLRREQIHRNIVLRSAVISSIRRRMIEIVIMNFRPQSSRLPRQKVHAISWCLVGCTRGNFMLCLKLLSNLNKCLWWQVLIDIFR